MTTVEQPTVEALVRETLAAHKSLYLATTGADGPWVSGVYFAENGLYELLLVLEERGRTLKAIRENPKVAVVVATGSPMAPFLQARAIAEIVADDVALQRRLIAKVPEAAPFLDTPIRSVRLTVPSWRVTDIPNGWLPGKEISG